MKYITIDNNLTTNLNWSDTEIENFQMLIESDNNKRECNNEMDTVMQVEAFITLMKIISYVLWSS